MGSCFNQRTVRVSIDSVVWHGLCPWTQGRCSPAKTLVGREDEIAVIHELARRFEIDATTLEALEQWAEADVDLELVGWRLADEGASALGEEA